MCDALCVPLYSCSNSCHIVIIFLQNVSDNTLKRVIQYMRSAKFVEAHHYPLEDLDPSIGPCVYKKGNLSCHSKGSKPSPTKFLHRNMHHFSGHKVLVRCLRLLKPYSKKSIAEDDIDEDNDDDDEDYTEAGRALPAEGRIMEQDMLSQAYHIGKHTHSKHICGVEWMWMLFCLFIVSRKKQVFKALLSCILCRFSSVLLRFKGNSPVWPQV